MTHDELLAKIHEEDSSVALFVGARTSLADALRAVVELHKPLYYRKGEADTKGAHCSECSQGSHGDKAVDYPCPTIQTIKKELR